MPQRENMMLLGLLKFPKNQLDIICILATILPVGYPSFTKTFQPTSNLLESEMRRWGYQKMIKRSLQRAYDFPLGLPGCIVIFSKFISCLTSVANFWGFYEMGFPEGSDRKV